MVENVTQTDKEGKSCANYEKFKSKRVVTFVLSLDYREPIYYVWKDENNFNSYDLNIYSGETRLLKDGIEDQPNLNYEYPNEDIKKLVLLE